jgi:hypothetical protein
MITEEDIDIEMARIASAVTVKYNEDKMSAVDLGNRLEYIAKYGKITKRCLKSMKNLEFML